MPRGRPRKKEAKPAVKKKVPVPATFKAPDLVTGENVTYIEIPIEQIIPNEWNPNVLAPPDQARLSNSLEKFGQVENLVVRQTGDKYELIGGEHRWKQLKKQNKPTAICAVVNLNEEDAMLLSEVLNHLHGNPDLDKHSDFYKRLTQSIDVASILRFVPSTEEDIANIIAKITAESKQVARSAAGEEDRIEIKLSATKEQAEVINQAFQILARQEGISDISSKSTKAFIVEMLCADYLSGVGVGVE